MRSRSSGWAAIGAGMVISPEGDAVHVSIHGGDSASLTTRVTPRWLPTIGTPLNRAGEHGLVLGFPLVP